MSREAMQLALEALVQLDGIDTETECVTIDVDDVITALRQALETEKQEPVAWLDPEENRSDEAFRWGQTEHHIVPLYNHAQRTTLSDDEFISMLDSAGLAVGPELAFEIKEMVEAAHGIKGDA